MPLNKGLPAIHRLDGQYAAALDQDAAFRAAGALAGLEVVINPFDPGGQPKLPLFAGNRDFAVAIQPQDFPRIEQQTGICNHGYHP